MSNLVEIILCRGRPHLLLVSLFLGTSGGDQRSSGVLATDPALQIEGLQLSDILLFRIYFLSAFF